MTPDPTNFVYFKKFNIFTDGSTIKSPLGAYNRDYKVELADLIEMENAFVILNKQFLIEAQVFIKETQDAIYIESVYDELLEEFSVDDMYDGYIDDNTFEDSNGIIWTRVEVVPKPSTIDGKIDYIYNAYNNIKSAIIEKGVDVGNDISEYADNIREIKTGINATYDTENYKLTFTSGLEVVDNTLILGE